MDNHSKPCVIVSPRETDYVAGENSPIVFKAVTSGDWTSHIEFFERQMIGFETDGCTDFTGNENFDAQMDALIGTFPQSVIEELTAMGYMDTGIDGNLHFHSSPRYTQVMSGIGTNGGTLPLVWDTMRKYGVLPWTDLPFDATITEAEYFAPVPEALQVKAQQFLALIGGKNAIQYHWLLDGNGPDLVKMKAALPQAPLCIGSSTCGDWNEVSPAVCADRTPQHSTMIYAITDAGSSCLDHYLPFEKVLAPTYPIPYVLQAVVAPVFTAPAPSVTIPAIPATIQPTPQNVSLLQQIVALYTQILSLFQNPKGRLGSITTMNYLLFRSRTFWTLVFAFAYNVWQLLAPTVAPSISVVLNILFTTVASYFHLEGVQNAAVASAAAAAPVSGQ